MRGTGSSSEILYTFCVSVLAILGSNNNNICIIIGSSHINYFHTLSSHTLPSNVCIIDATLDARSQGIPSAGDNFKFPPINIADCLSNHNVIAVCITARYVGNGHGTIGIVHLCPVKRSICALHCNSENAVFQSLYGRRVYIFRNYNCIDYSVCCRLKLFYRFASFSCFCVLFATGSEGKHRDKSHEQCKNSFYHFICVLSLELFHENLATGLTPAGLACEAQRNNTALNFFLPRQQSSTAAKSFH